MDAGGAEVEDQDAFVVKVESVPRAVATGAVVAKATTCRSRLIERRSQSRLLDRTAPVTTVPGTDTIPRMVADAVRNPRRAEVEDQYAFIVKVGVKELDRLGNVDAKFL